MNTVKLKEDAGSDRRFILGGVGGGCTLKGIEEGKCSGGANDYTSLSSWGSFSPCLVRRLKARSFISINLTWSLRQARFRMVHRHCSMACIISVVHS